MKKIKGNVMADFQGLVIARNEIGEEVKGWKTISSHKGFLDLSSGSSSYLGQNAKTVEATHVFICDAFQIDRAAVSRLVIKGRDYDVLYFDEPMGMDEHFEVYLKEKAQNGN